VLVTVFTLKGSWYAVPLFAVHVTFQLEESYVGFWDTVLTWVVQNVLSSFLPWEMVLIIPVLIEEVGFLVPITRIGKML